MSDIEKNYDWRGWEPKSGISKVSYFENEKVSCGCTIPCEKCGFNFLNADGEPLNMDENEEFLKNDTPLCGVW